MGGGPFFRCPNRYQRSSPQFDVNYLESKGHFLHFISVFPLAFFGRIEYNI